jgi:hypothetical protein
VRKEGRFFFFLKKKEAKKDFYSVEARDCRGVV